MILYNRTAWGLDTLGWFFAIFTRKTTLFPSRLSYTPSQFWKRIDTKRKEFAPTGEDPISEGCYNSCQNCLPWKCISSACGYVPYMGIEGKFFLQCPYMAHTKKCPILCRLIKVFTALLNSGRPYLTLSLLGKNFSRHFEIVFLFS